MMIFDVFKEEIRNKRGELLTGLLASGFALAIAQTPSLAGLCAMVAVVAGGLLGIKDWSLGRKLIGGAFTAFSIILFFQMAAVNLGGSECWQEATTEAALENCREADAGRVRYVRHMSGMIMILLLANALFGCFLRKRLHTPSTFAAQFEVQEPTRVPNRWFSKEKGFETFVLEELEHAGITGRQRYEWMCDVRGIAPERHDGTTRYDWKAQEILAEAPWQSVYDLIERCWPFLGFLHKDHFERRVNEHLREAQIGWVFENGKWTRVGDEIGEGNLQKAADVCEDLGAQDARIDLMNAWKLCNSLGEGYEKDAVSAATRALERIVQEKANQPGVSLSRIKWKNPDFLHEKLRGVINSLYSYSSEQARHAHERATITARDAHFVVSVSASLIVYLAEEHPESAREDSLSLDSGQGKDTEPKQEKP